MKYLVQCTKNCTEFSSLEYARKHAELAGGGSIWDRSVVSEIQGNAVSVPMGCQPLERV